LLDSLRRAPTVRDIVPDIAPDIAPDRVSEDGGGGGRPGLH
jgi:hypothetical protein